jgi:hypothetical protein
LVVLQELHVQLIQIASKELIAQPQGYVNPGKEIERATLVIQIATV